MTTSTDDSQSPASKAFAARLSRYAYRPQPSPASPGQSKSDPRQSVYLKPATGSQISPSSGRTRGPDPYVSPVRANDDSSGGARKRRRLKIEADDEDPSGSDCGDDEYEDHSTASKGRGSVKTNKTSFTTKRSTSIPKTDGDANYSKDTISIERTAKSPGKKPRPFAGPEVYAHLKPVSDHLGPGLRSGSLPLASESFNAQDADKLLSRLLWYQSRLAFQDVIREAVVLIPRNSGKRSSTLGHHFAHPTNKFWKSLHYSGITPRLVSPLEDASLPELFQLGLTNLCDRPTAEQSELSTLEMKLNVAQLTRKIAKHRPLVVCFVGKKIWDIYEGVVSKTALAQELQPEVLKVEAARRGVKVELPDTPPPGINAPPLGARSDSELSSPLSEEGQQGSVVGTHLNEQVIETDLPEDIKPTVNITQSPSTPLKRAKSEMISLPASSERKAKSPGATKGVMDWTAPRPFRLPWPEGGGHTYFWVTPNTSGLERTPLKDQIGIFTHLKLFTESLSAGSSESSSQVAFRDIQVDRVEDTVRAIQAAAEAKAAKGTTKRGRGQT